MSEGQGLFVGWYDTDPSYQPELDLWHSKEHMPERARLPGFLTAQRYKSLCDSNRYCVLYRADSVEAFVSRPYLDVLNSPTEWTRKMMPGVLNLNRTLCQVVQRGGEGFGGVLVTVKCSPAPEARIAFSEWLSEEAFPASLAEFGIVRLELAIADQEASRLKTREQELRQKPDEIADWVLLVEAYSEGASEAFGDPGPLSRSEIEAHGAKVSDLDSFRLVHLISSG